LAGKRTAPGENGQGRGSGSILKGMSGPEKRKKRKKKAPKGLMNWSRWGPSSLQRRGQVGKYSKTKGRGGDRKRGGGGVGCKEKETAVRSMRFNQIIP